MSAEILLALISDLYGQLLDSQALIKGLREELEAAQSAPPVSA